MLAYVFAKSPRFQPFDVQLTSLTTVVIAGFELEVEIPPFRHMLKLSTKWREKI